MNQSLFGLQVLIHIFISGRRSLCLLGDRYFILGKNFTKQRVLLNHLKDTLDNPKPKPYNSVKNQDIKEFCPIIHVEALIL